MRRSMKKSYFFSLMISLCLILPGCGSMEEPPSEPEIVEEVAADITSTTEITEEPLPKDSVPNNDPVTAFEVPTENSDLEDAVVDLTVMSSTMVYGQVYNMMYYPEKFIGKTVKMKGLYSDYFDQAHGKHYYACIIMDATACCSQGVEFILTDDYKYPDDYPEQGDEITVEGIFDVYEEDDGSYCTLRDASLLSG